MCFFCNIYHKFLLDIIFDILIMLYCVFLFCILDKILLIIIYIVHGFDLLWLWFFKHVFIKNVPDRWTARLEDCISVLPQYLYVAFFVFVQRLNGWGCGCLAMSLQLDCNPDQSDGFLFVQVQHWHLSAGSNSI